jgi:hypothetical protein
MQNLYFVKHFVNCKNTDEYNGFQNALISEHRIFRLANRIFK